MSAAPSPPANKPPAAPGTPSTPGASTQVSSGLGAVFGALAIFPIVLLFMFHLGAGYLSYQKYGNIGWAILNFFFAYFYYPYYAFFLSGCPVEAPLAAPALFGGFMKLLGGKSRRR